MRFTLYADYSLLQKKGEESLECKLQKILENQVTHLKVVSVFLFEGKEFFVAHGLVFSKNQKVFYLEKQIRKLGFKNVRFSVLKGKGNKNDLYKKLVKSGEIYSFRNVKIIPFFINFGNHVKKNKRLFFDSKARYLILSLMDKENPVLNAFIVENHTDVKKDELKII